jgi:A/G-specific adenine glycosylase
MTRAVAATAITSALARWARKHGRRLPWRNKPNLYRLAVAEVLLQKTKGEDVLPVWRSVIDSYPTAAALAGTSNKVLWEIVAPLGLGNQRVQRLKGMAKALVEDTIEKMPGLGPYAGAILQLARKMDPQAMPVDGNIARVVTRFWGLTFERGEPRKKPEVRELVSTLLATQREHRRKLQIVYALVDLGAKVCRTPSPECPDCPISKWCAFPSKESRS